MKHSLKGEGSIQGGSLSAIPSVEITEMTTVIKYIFKITYEFWVRMKIISNLMNFSIPCY